MNKREYWKFLGSMMFTVMASYATMMVDAAVGGRFIGEHFVSVVNLLQPVNETFSSIAIIFGAGANTVAAIAYGKGDINAVRRYFSVGLTTIGLILGICLVFVLCFRSTIAWNLSEGGLLYDDTLKYLSVIVFFSALNCVYMIVKLFTAMVGRPQLILLCAIVQMIVNFGFDLLFVKVFHYGIEGLGYASIAAILIVLCILLPGCLRPNSAFRPIRVNFSEFIDTLRRISKVGSGYLMSSVTYLLFYFAMNVLVLRYLNESGLLAWSVVMMIYTIGYTATGAAQETCLSLGGRYLGASDRESFRKVYRKSSRFYSVWICITIILTTLFPEKTLPLLGISPQSIDQGIVRVILYAIPFLFGSNILNLLLIRLLQEERVTTYMITNTIQFLSVPMLFALFSIVAPEKAWLGLTALTPVYLILGFYLYRLYNNRPTTLSKYRLH